MALTKSNLLTDIAEDLNGYNDYDITTEGAFLERCLERALDDLWKSKAWSFKIGKSTLSTTANNLGPYDTPSDFEGFIPPERIDTGWAYSVLYNVDNPIQDTDEAIRFRVNWKRYDNKIYFATNPGNRDLNLFYSKTRPELSDLSDVPDEPWITDYLSSRTGYHALKHDPDTKQDASDYMQMSDKVIRDQWASLRRSQKRQISRTPMSVHGYPLKEGLRGTTFWNGNY